MVPWISRFFDVQIIHGWPFILSRYRDGSLEELIANPLAWSLEDRLVSLIQIVRALRLAQTRGIAAHQDLKPGNVFFDDLSRKGVPKEGKGMHFHMFVGDFGLADAFRDFGRNTGSRPYMAPEQFSSSPIEPTAPASFDIFALGVIAFEVFTDGRHPIGVTTADVWPRRQGIPRKWDRESTWREWAGAFDKSRQVMGSLLPAGTEDLYIEVDLA
jgi:serine/threonine protein kinase